MRNLGSPNYCYPNAVDPHSFQPYGEGSGCWYCGKNSTSPLHAEPRATEFEAQVRAARARRAPDQRTKGVAGNLCRHAQAIEDVIEGHATGENPPTDDQADA